MEIYPRAWWFCQDKKQIELYAQNQEGKDICCLFSITDLDENVGELQAFLSSYRIRPYNPITIEGGEPLEEEGMLTLLEPSIKGTLVQGSTAPMMRILFFDLEVLSEDRRSFPSAQKEGDYIFMISAITMEGERKKEYLWLLAPLSLELEGVEVYTSLSERDLLASFVQLWSSFSPHRVVTYNGETFDIPYLHTRLKLHELEAEGLSKSKDAKISMRRRVNTPIGVRSFDSIALVGSESYDLLLFYRLSHPWLPDRRLDTVGRYLLGARKTDLHIQRLWENALSNDPQKLRENAAYSLQDSRLLPPLYSLTIETSNAFCSEARILLTDLLLDPLEEVVARLVYNLDPQWLPKPSTERENNDQSPKPGWYKDVILYDYTTLYLQALQKSQDSKTRNLGLILEKAPLALRGAAFYSGYPCEDVYLHLCSELEHLPPPLVVTPYLLLSINPLPLPKVGNYEWYWILDHGAVAKGEQGYLYQGNHPFNFPLARSWLEAQVEGRSIPPLESASLTDLRMDRSKAVYPLEHYRELLSTLPKPHT